MCWGLEIEHHNIVEKVTIWFSRGGLVEGLDSPSEGMDTIPSEGMDTIPGERVDVRRYSLVWVRTLFYLTLFLWTYSSRQGDVSLDIPEGAGK